MHDLVGREPELAAIDAALTRARSGVTVLRIEGEAGIGKSALMDLAVRRTIASGSRVLACRTTCLPTPHGAQRSGPHRNGEAVDRRLAGRGTSPREHFAVAEWTGQEEQRLTA
jgi:hypothetical protein